MGYIGAISEGGKEDKLRCSGFTTLPISYSFSLLADQDNFL